MAIHINPIAARQFQTVLYLLHKIATSIVRIRKEAILVWNQTLK
jgi:hypothetical protein